MGCTYVYKGQGYTKEQFQKMLPEVLSRNPAAGPEAGALVIPSKAEIKAALKKAPEAIDNFILKVAGTTKAVPFSGDASALLNQSLKLGVVNAKGFGEAAQLLPKVAFSPKAAAEFQTNLSALDRKMGGIMQKSGLFEDIDDVASAFQNNLFSNVQGAKQYLAASDRAYSIPISAIRASTFLKWIAPHLQAGKTFQSHPQLFKSYAKAINVLSGKGDLGPLKGAAGILNSIFISPRNLASKFQQFQMILDPRPSNKTPMPVRVDMLKAHAKFYSGYAALLAMAKMAGYDVETEDPTHPDFGKIRRGKVRIDLGTGDLSLFRALAIIKEGKRTRVSGERVRETPFETGKDYLGNKLTGLSSVTYKWLSEKSDDAKERAIKEFVKGLVPIWGGQDMVELLQQPDVDAETKALFGATSFAGGRMNIYEAPPELTSEDKGFMRREESARDEAYVARKRAAIPPAPPKSRRDQALSAEKGLMAAKFQERAMAALRSGNRNAAMRIAIEARIKGVDIDIMELQKRLRSASPMPEGLPAERRP